MKCNHYDLEAYNKNREEQIILREIIDELYKFIMLLPIQERKTIYMYAAGFTTKKMAFYLKRNGSRVRVYKQRAISKLRIFYGIRFDKKTLKAGRQKNLTLID